MLRRLLLVHVPSVFRQLNLKISSKANRFVTPGKTYCTEIQSESGKSLANQSSGTEDILASQIKKASGSKRLIELTRAHYNVMNNNHLIVILEKLFHFKREHNEIVSLDSSDFRSLCVRLQQRARFFDSEDVVNILKILSYLGVPTSSNVVQTYFQMLRHYINELTVQQVLYLDFLLMKQSSTPLVEALRIALPMVMENQVLQQVDSDNLEEVAQLYSYATKYNLSMKVREQLADIILESKAQVSLRSAKKIMWSVLTTKKSVQSTPSCTALLTSAVSVCTIEIDKINTVELSALVSRLSNKNFYFAEFTQAVCERAVDEKWPFPVMHTLVCSLNVVNYVDLRLLDVYCENIEQNSSNICSNPKYSIYSILNSFAFTNYQPRKPDAILNLLTTCKEKIEDFQVKCPELYVKLLLNACVLNSPPCVLKDLCPPDYLENLHIKLELGQVQKSIRDSLLIDLVLLNQLSVVHDLHLQRLPKTLKDEAMQSIKESREDFPLRHALQTALGGRHYVKTSVLSPMGVFIDHLLVVRKGNYPVAFSNQDGGSDSHSSRANYDDSTPPSDAKKIAILVQSPDSLAANVNRANGHSSLRARVLEHEGYVPIMVLENVWKELPDHEQIPFIMREIRDRVSSLENVETSTRYAEVQ